MQYTKDIGIYVLQQTIINTIHIESIVYGNSKHVEKIQLTENSGRIVSVTIIK